ncbi:MAG: SGNH/GDSL hydrolase family protein [Lentisphaerae bacterium]|nr:SGNH/GDSL hydrolase family protein [Lentisphaerota bacterium]
MDHMERLWKNNNIYRESGMFAGKKRINLMFPAQNIISVTAHVSGEVFLSGRDFYHEPGDNFITWSAGSKIPYLPPESLHPTAGNNLRLYPDPTANAVSGAVNGGNLLFDNRDFFALNQVDISYTTLAMDFSSDLDFQRDRLPYFREKLARQQPLKITLIGDSISFGLNATKVVDSPPFAPCYIEQVAAAAGVNISVCNRAVSGTGICDAADIEADYLEDSPNLLIIAYGMNNFAGMPVELFVSKLQELISSCRMKNPHTEYVVVSSMSGHPGWKPTPPGPDRIYAEELRKFVASQDSYVALADVHKVWCKFLERKDFYDLTGNGVNHPNDYGHRIYASVILELLTGKKFFN